MTENKKKRQQRRKKTGEDFTPLTFVNEILDRLSKESNNEVWKEDKTFADPACGNGNFLIEVLKRKLNLKHDPIKALATIYGADIMLDNIQECRARLLKVLVSHKKLSEKEMLEAIKILGRNLKHTPLKKYPNGSLDYDFDFKDKVSDDRAKKAMEKIQKENILDKVDIMN